jgi:hypothetical protein
MKRTTNLRARHMALLLIIASFVLYGVDYFVFGHAPEIAAGFLGNIAFLPLYVLFVTLMIERVIKERERHVIRQKLNMVIGVFFSEVGTELMRHLAGFLVDCQELAQRLKVTGHWTNRDFRAAEVFLAGHPLKVDIRAGELTFLREFLLEKRGFMLGLLENPNLLEHDEFTDLLWAVTHLLQELEARQRLAGLPDSDLEHLSGDIIRASAHLLREWVVYMRHLRHDYPYLFSLAVRMNPLDPEARPEVV